MRERSLGTDQTGTLPSGATAPCSRCMGRSRTHSGPISPLQRSPLPTSTPHRICRLQRCFIYLTLPWLRRQEPPAGIPAGGASRCQAGPGQGVPGVPPARFSGRLGRQEAAASPGLPSSAACRLQTFRLPTSTCRGKGQGSELPHGHPWDRSVPLPAARGTRRGWQRLRHAPRQRAEGRRGLPGPAAASGSEPGWATVPWSPVPRGTVGGGMRGKGPCEHAAGAPRQR